MVNFDIDPDPVTVVRPFGYPGYGGRPKQPPLKQEQIANYAPPSQTYALVDADQGNVQSTVSWFRGLPKAPVHGKVRNELFFDWHAAAVKLVAAADGL